MAFSLESLFISVVNMSITASYVILFILIARLLLKKAPKVFSYSLWAVVLLRLICPFSFASASSFLQTIVKGSMEYIPSDIGMAAQPQINTGISRLDHIVNTSLPAATPYASINPMQVIIFVSSAIWALGIAFLLFYSTISYIMLRCNIRTAILLYNNIFECENTQSPFVLGIINPKIYIPTGLKDTEKKYILQHEKTHIRRFDYIIKPIAFLTLCIHWFNPLVWLSFALSSKDMEMSCDERVLKELGTDIKKEYSISLLSMAAGRKIINVSPLSFGEISAKSRIKNVLSYRKPAFWIVISALIVVICVSFGLLANPKHTDYKNQKQPVSLTNLVMAEENTTLSKGSKITLKLIMTEGKYFSEAYAGIGGGTYTENYQGKYEIQVLNMSGKLISKCNFNIDEDETANFAGRFEILFDDYNSDGNPDFSIGQWGSSNGNLYNLYTLTEDGVVKKINLQPIFHISHDFSVRFDKDDATGFHAQFYNNAVGKMGTVHYYWDKTDGCFKKREEAD